MYNVYWQEGNKIEITIFEELTQSEMEQIIHQLESLSAMYQEINVLIDAVKVKRYDLRIMIENYDFYKKYSKHLKKVAIVSDRKFANWLGEQLNKFTETELKVFKNDELEDARQWIFPSRLP
jgi:vacuolar-type H+-ATPase subunit B/Vma2